MALMMEIYPAPSRFSIKVFLMATSQRNSLQSYSNSNPVYLKFISAWNQKAGMANWAQLGGLILRVINCLCAHFNHVMDEAVYGSSCDRGIPCSLSGSSLSRANTVVRICDQCTFISIPRKYFNRHIKLEHTSHVKYDPAILVWH